MKTIKGWAIVGLMAMTFIIAFRWIASKLKVSALENLGAAA